MTYSIIIPHRDIPELLQRCLDSIPSRSDVQVIVVYDNSDPSKVDFDHFPGSDRDDVELIFRKEGKGAGYARNVGMEHAHGKWLLFADADDFFHEGLLGMLDNWKDSDNQIVFFRTDSVDSDTLEVRENRLFFVDYEDVNSLRYRNFVPWGKMISYSLVKDNNLSFDEIEVSNDVMFSVRSGYLADKVSLSSDVMYSSTYRNDSLVHRITPERLEQRIDVCYRYNEFCKIHNINFNLSRPAMRYIRELKSINRTGYYIQILRYIWKTDKKQLLLSLKRRLGELL